MSTHPTDPAQYPEDALPEPLCNLPGHCRLAIVAHTADAVQRALAAQQRPPMLSGYLTTSPPPPRLTWDEEAPQPVAWRWKAPKLRGWEWRYSVSKTREDAEPLYATPPANQTPETAQ